MDREGHGSGDEAHLVSLIVQAGGERGITPLCNGHGWAQGDLGEFACAGTIFGHRADGFVGVGGDDDAGFGGEVEVPEQVALGQGGHEELFGVPARGVASKAGSAEPNKTGAWPAMLSWSRPYVPYPAVPAPRLPVHVTTTS